MEHMMNYCSGNRQELLFTGGTVVHKPGDNLCRMKSRDIFAANLNKAINYTNISIAELARKSGVSSRHLRYILSGERGPSVDMADDIAHALGLEGYHLQMPSFDPGAIKNGNLDKIYRAYLSADDGGRKILEAQADYLSTRNDQPANHVDVKSKKSSAS